MYVCTEVRMVNTLAPSAASVIKRKFFVRLCIRHIYRQVSKLSTVAAVAGE